MLSEWKQQYLSIIVGITPFRSIISSIMYYYTNVRKQFQEHLGSWELLFLDQLLAILCITTQM